MQTKLLHEDGGRRTFAVVLQTGDEAMRCLQEVAAHEQLSVSQMKQCANKAKARTAPAGRSRRALRSTPALPVKVARTMDAVGLEKVIWHLARSRNLSRV
jgi:hypothetical protein